MAQVNFKFVSNTKGLQDGLKKSSNSLQKFENTTKKVSNGIGKALGSFGLALGLSAITAQLKQATMAAQEDIISQRQLARQLAISAKMTGKAAASAENYVSKLALATGVADDKLRPALATALRVTGDFAKAQDLLNLSLDVSAGTGKDLETVVKSVGRAYLGNSTGLQRLVPGIKKTDDALAFLRKNFEGARETLADPFAKLTVAIDEAQEQIGTLLLPYVQQFVTFLTEKGIPAVSEFIDDISNPNTDVGKTFVAMKEAIVGRDGKSGVYGSVLLLVDAIGNLFGSLSSNGNALDGLVKAFEILAISLDVILFNIASIINQPLSGFADRVKKQIYGAAAINAVLSRESLFGTSYNNIAAPGQVALSPRMAEAAATSNNYTININKANMTPQEIIAAIKQYERSGGKK